MLFLGWNFAVEWAVLLASNLTLHNVHAECLFLMIFAPSLQEYAGVICQNKPQPLSCVPITSH